MFYLLDKKVLKKFINTQNKWAAAAPKQNTKERYLSQKKLNHATLLPYIERIQLNVTIMNILILIPILEKQHDTYILFVYHL